LLLISTCALHQGFFETGLIGDTSQQIELRFHDGPVQTRHVRIKVVRYNHHPALRAGVLVVGSTLQVRGPGRKPGASSYTLTRLSLSLSTVQVEPGLTALFVSANDDLLKHDKSL